MKENTYILGTRRDKARAVSAGSTRQCPCLAPPFKDLLHSRIVTLMYDGTATSRDESNLLCCAHFACARHREAPFVAAAPRPLSTTPTGPQAHHLTPASWIHTVHRVGESPIVDIAAFVRHCRSPFGRLCLSSGPSQVLQCGCLVYQRNLHPDHTAVRCSSCTLCTATPFVLPCAGGAPWVWSWR